MEYKTHKCIKKLDRPILTKDDMPYDASLIFNAGVAKINGKYVMIFRNDYGTTKEKFESGEQRKLYTSVGIAFSDNGIDNWRVCEKPIVDSVNMSGETIRLYDPRITVIDGVPYLCLAKDTHHGVCGCIARLNEQLDGFEILYTSVPDNRNMVLFPEKIDGKYVRLERPFPVYSRWHKDIFDIWISKSPDLKYWGENELLLGVEDVPFANDKIGPAAPPIKTDKGWLTTFHAVDIDENRGKNGWENAWKKRYTAGIMLLDLENPSKVIGIYKEPLIVADEEFEQKDGFRQNVIFPGGMIAEPDGTVKIYYGASDTVECVATADIDDLVELCLNMTFDERKAQVKSYLGKVVDIKIDRPIGYVHKKEKYSLTYPVNYGYIPGVLGGDGEELDVYLLGVDTPVDEYTCKIIGIVHRHNDIEDKLIAAPEGVSFTADEIKNLINFQEQYYDTEIEV